MCIRDRVGILAAVAIGMLYNSSKTLNALNEVDLTGKVTTENQVFQMFDNVQEEYLNYAKQNFGGEKIIKLTGVEGEKILDLVIKAQAYDSNKNRLAENTHVKFVLDIADYENKKQVEKAIEQLVALKKNAPRSSSIFWIMGEGAINASRESGAVGDALREGISAGVLVPYWKMQRGSGISSTGFISQKVYDKCVEMSKGFKPTVEHVSAILENINLIRAEFGTGLSEKYFTALNGDLNSKIKGLVKRKAAIEKAGYSVEQIVKVLSMSWMIDDLMTTKVNPNIPGFPQESFNEELGVDVSDIAMSGEGLLSSSSTEQEQIKTSFIVPETGLVMTEIVDIEGDLQDVITEVAPVTIENMDTKPEIMVKSLVNWMATTGISMSLMPQILKMFESKVKDSEKRKRVQEIGQAA